MPAIQLARLKIQITDLMTNFDRPIDFVRELHMLLGFYADRTRRPGQSGTPKPLIKAYNVPKQVMQRIISDISQQVVDDPNTALILADHLWEDDWFECRLLAINILGLLPLDNQNLIVDRLVLWGNLSGEDVMLGQLLHKGAARIREETPNKYQVLVEEWLTDTEKSFQKLGLQALPALAMNPEFDNLPVLFRLISPLVRESVSTLETDLLLAVRALGRRSPRETAFFLKQNLIAPHKNGLEVITRRSLDVFPLDLQVMLREALRTQMKDPSSDY